MKTETSPSPEQLEARVADLVEEVEETAGQYEAAVSQVKQAQQRFAELEERRTSLAASAFRGDSKSQLEIEALEDEHDELERSTRVTRAAVPELERMLAESKERLKDARNAVHRARANDLRQQVESLNSERDHHADALLEVLNRQKSLEGALTTTLNRFDQTTANARASDREGPQRRWVKKKFRDWL